MILSKPEAASTSQGWTDNEIFNNIRGEQRRHKKSSLTLPHVKRADDCKKLTVNNQCKDTNKLPNIANHYDSSSNSPEDSRKAQREKELIKCYSKPKRGSKNKFIKRLPHGDRFRRPVPGDMDRRDSGVEKKLTPDETILRLTGGIELVPLLARRRRVGARTLPSSDVTRLPEETCQWRELMTEDYLRQLKQQMRVKCLQKEESRRNSAESVKQHHETWASLWGRPGHGAPQLRGRYARSNLAQLLYVAPFNDPIENV
ncbi:unnamed protein product [Leptosia nina]|uniref:Uncharacterized protein n=1 Tax=Leptosia nina TaxID=320188 RepID=A0AAV1J9M9_9NEOP